MGVNILVFRATKIFPPNFSWPAVCAVRAFWFLFCISRVSWAGVETTRNVAWLKNGVISRPISFTFEWESVGKEWVWLLRFPPWRVNYDQSAIVLSGRKCWVPVFAGCHTTNPKFPNLENPFRKYAKMLGWDPFWDIRAFFSRQLLTARFKVKCQVQRSTIRA